MMKRSLLAVAAAALTLATASTADARACKRLNKTEGAAVGAVGGAILGGIVGNGTGAVLGAVGGGVAGHEIARTKYNRHCRYYRRSRR